MCTYMYKAERVEMPGDRCVRRFGRKKVLYLRLFLPLELRGVVRRVIIGGGSPMSVAGRRLREMRVADELAFFSHRGKVIGSVRVYALSIQSRLF